MKFTASFHPQNITNPSKTLYLKKISLSSQSNSPYKKELHSIFNDPSSYLKLPAELNLPFVVGKKLCGPRYDIDDRVIPYSIVGNPRIFKKRNLNANISRTSSMMSRMTTREVKTTEPKSNIVTDNEIHNIFTRCKDNIESNTNRANEFMTSVPKKYKDRTIKPLLLQQKVIASYEENEKIENLLSERIKNRLLTKSKKSSRTSTINTSSSSINNKELLMQSMDSFRMKKETMEYIQNTEDARKKYGRNYWALSLRHPPNFKGIRQNYINLGSKFNPLWCTIRERLPVINETVINPKCSAKVIDNESLESYMKTSPSLINYMNKTMNMIELEIKGRDLLKVEEENVKLLKGKKKLVHLKYDKESLRDINIIENWK